MFTCVPKETADGERRVALVPDSLQRIKGSSVTVERSAGEQAGFLDESYVAAGASLAPDPKSLYADADLVLKVQPLTPSEATQLKAGAAVVSLLYPLTHLPTVKAISERGATAFAMDLMPRISRAQSMDVLSSQSLVAGYKAVMLAADSLPKIFPLLMTAAGTITPARVFVVGAGVAGLEAVATAHRMGALVEAYDVRPAVKEQVESLGARFVELPLDTADSQTAGGYAKAQTEEFYLKQRQLLAEHARQADVVITTALVPGAKAPLLITEDAVKGMRPGSVVIDLAAEQGGNCALTEPGKTVVKFNVSIQGPLNLPSTMAQQASQLLSRNITTFLQPMIKDGKLTVDKSDELVRGTLVVDQGKVVHEPTRAALEGAAK